MTIWWKFYTFFKKIERIKSSLGVVFFKGTTEKTLIDVLTQRSSAQRQLIAKAYEKATGRVFKYTCLFNFQAFSFFDVDTDKGQIEFVIIGAGLDFIPPN